MPPRIAAFAQHDGLLGVMPAYLPSAGLACKLVTLFPRNRDRHTHQALICLFDEENGTPVALMDGTYITATRTAAGSALATRLLAREDARVLAILGAGVQARAHAKALGRVREFTEIRVASRDRANAEQLAEEIGGTGGGFVGGGNARSRRRRRDDALCGADRAARVAVAGRPRQLRRARTRPVAGRSTRQRSRKRWSAVESQRVDARAASGRRAGVPGGRPRRRPSSSESWSRARGRDEPPRSRSPCISQSASPSRTQRRPHWCSRRRGSGRSGARSSWGNRHEQQQQRQLQAGARGRRRRRDGDHGARPRGRVAALPRCRHRAARRAGSRTRTSGGCSSTTTSNSKMPDPEPYEPARLTGNAPADLQAETARLSGEWKLGKLNEISDEQAREDLGRLSAQMMSIVARSARLADGKTDQVPDDVVAQREDRRGEVPPQVARRGRPASRAGDRHVLDLHGRAWLERLDVHRSCRRVDRRRLRRGALVGRGGALRPVARRRAGVRQADARRGQEDRAIARSGCEDALDAEEAHHGLRSSRLPRGRSALAHPQADRAGARLAVRRGGGAAREGGARGAPEALARTASSRRTSSTTRPSSSTSPRSRRRSRPRCSRARVSPAGRRTFSSRRGRAACSVRPRATSARPSATSPAKSQTRHSV